MGCLSFKVLLKRGPITIFFNVLNENPKLGPIALKIFSPMKYTIVSNWPHFLIVLLILHFILVSIAALWSDEQQK